MRRRAAARAAAFAALTMLTATTACSDNGPAASATDPTPAASDQTSTADTAGTDTTAAATTEAPPATAPPVTSPLTSESAVLETVAAGFERPVDISWRAGDDRMFVVSQAGQIFPVSADGAVGEPVLDLGREVTTEGEQGLLGLAFHPTDSLAYINYTDASGDTVVAEYQVADDGAFSSPREVITIAQPHANHNGGDLAFGPDGMLYIGMGDGGAGADPDRRSLDLGDLLGKILRIDPAPSDGQGYTVPSDNPFVDTPGAAPEIWATGLRNPWRFSFDSATGDLWIGDVGQGDWEEVDVARAADGGGRGTNFGWSAFEGTHRYNDDQSADGVLMPVYEYSHGEGGCSVSGGAVYRGTAVPSLVGWFVFSDYCSGRVLAIPATSTPDGIADVAPVEVAVAGGVSAVVVGPDGEVYVLAHSDGAVLRLTAA